MPLTRAWTLTDSGDSRCPVYSSHSITSRRSGWLTVTAGGGGGGGGPGRVQPAGAASAAAAATEASSTRFP